MRQSCKEAGGDYFRHKFWDLGGQREGARGRVGGETKV
jgi:hypothetical protein